MLRITLIALTAAVALAAPRSGSRGPDRYAWGEEGCGISSYDDAGAEPLGYDPYIVGGWETRVHEFPWQVSLLWLGSHFCGGSLAGPNWVITAAHCVEGDNPNQLNVRIGEHYRNNANPNARTVGVVANTWHPRYDETGNIEFDIAILELAEDIAWSDAYQPICAPRSGDDGYVGETCSVSGWGSTQSGGSSTQELRVTNMPIITRASCADAFPSGWVDDTMMCAGNIGSNDRDACQGDSGGPLMVKDSDGAFDLVGIVSWGIGCAEDTPGVYADVQVFESWIVDTMP